MNYQDKLVEDLGTVAAAVENNNRLMKCRMVITQVVDPVYILNHMKVNIKVRKDNFVEGMKRAVEMMEEVDQVYTLHLRRRLLIHLEIDKIWTVAHFRHPLMINHFHYPVDTH